MIHFSRIPSGFLHNFKYQHFNFGVTRFFFGEKRCSRYLDGKETAAVETAERREREREKEKERERGDFFIRKKYASFNF